ncbi:hypothetical protein BJ085DRAFT_28381 [Dimargaris cristalligena]|uniref:Glutathione S-transferase n=1 Tax=Dimargaris cristalligena TaxID=215637 RepID=A0A4P9ZQX4_9FUNG|nr:hypothetical protein BJ085DRAFT_28381 [Dimargaris cristalligena]|eukprot:RKP35777.1 hypothetical protein BJ085DRAFT_28381 [Dimargaris cristalligena]
MSKFELLYAKFPGIAETSRCLLDYANAQWEPTYVDDLSLLGDTTPYGKVPVLREINADGQHIELCESRAIERYLARRFGLYSDDLVEAARIDAVVSQVDDVIRPLAFYRHSPKEVQPILVEQYRKEAQRFFARHGALLVANGDNGHYFGDRTTWADIAAYLVISRMKPFSQFDDELRGLMVQSHQKLVHTLEQDPNFQRYLERFAQRRASYQMGPI